MLKKYDAHHIQGDKKKIDKILFKSKKRATGSETCNPHSLHGTKLN